MGLNSIISRFQVYFSKKVSFSFVDGVKVLLKFNIAVRSIMQAINIQDSFEDLFVCKVLLWREIFNAFNRSGDVVNVWLVSKVVPHQV